jgi:Protein of unknown function (DUF5672)
MDGITKLRRKILKLAMLPFIRPYERERPATRRVAILIPMSSRTELTEEEKISMRQLLHHLPSYDKFMLVPEGLELSFNGFQTMWFPRKYFGSAGAHGKMLGTRDFYRKFLDYEFVFFFHLDSLAFSDQLEKWCSAGVDYIGPPWIRCEDSPWVDRPRVGNGGFTLLRVESAIKAITNRYLAKPSSFWFDLFTNSTPRSMVGTMEWIEKMFPWFWPVKRLLQEWREMEDPAGHNRNNDIFWSDLAPHYLPGFKVATLEQGLEFAFEVSPKTCFEMNGRRMPFGCHAWAKYDRSFWEPHIVPENSEGLKI